MKEGVLALLGVGQPVEGSIAPALATQLRQADVQGDLVGPGREEAPPGERVEIFEDLEQRFLHKVIDERVEFGRGGVDLPDEAAPQTVSQHQTQIVQGCLASEVVGFKVGDPFFVGAGRSHKFIRQIYLAMRRVL